MKTKSVNKSYSYNARFGTPRSTPKLPEIQDSISPKALSPEAPGDKGQLGMVTLIAFPGLLISHKGLL